MAAAEGTSSSSSSVDRAREAAGGRTRWIRVGAWSPRFRQGWWGEQLAIEADARSGFHLLPLGLMAGIALVYATGWRPDLPVWGALAAACCGMAFFASHRGLRTILIVAGCVTAGATLASAEFARNRTVLFSGEATVRIEGKVLWRDRDERERIRYLVVIERTERPVLSRPPDRAEILVSSKHAPIEVGARYVGLVRLRAPSGPAFPGGYDFAFGAFFKGVGAYAFALGPPDADKAVSSESLSIPERLVRLRLVISDRIRETIGGPEGAVASAIVTGERSGIPDDVDLWLRATGLSHVLSISGLHMALVVGFAMTLVRAVLALIPVVALHLPTKKIAAVAALGVAAFYLALSGFDVATTRSFVMIAIMLIAVLCDRSALTLRNVSIAALIVLATTPHAMMTASFQMSFGATAAIVAAYGTFARRRSDRDRRTRHFAVAILFSLIGIAASSLVAGLATAPYAAFHFQRIAPFGLVANMLALPIFSVWIMPLALIAMILMPFGLDAPTLWLLGKGLTLVFAIAHFLYERIPDSPTGLVAPSAFILLSVALVVACFLASRLRLAAIPIAIVGLVAATREMPRTDLLLFEDGRELVVFDRGGNAISLKPRPNGFVMDQWQRAFPPSGAKAEQSPFACETIVETDEPKPAGKPRQRRFCRMTFPSGFRVAWTDDHRLTGKACDEADLAIVARAIRSTSCRSGAHLVTLRTLRESGSISLTFAADGKPVIASSVIAPPEEWNRHRFAPWPEGWRRPVEVPPPVSP